MKRFIIKGMSFCVILLGLTGCGKTYTCGVCDKTFKGPAYTNGGGEAILCDKCATRYWNPFPISEHKYLD